MTDIRTIKGLLHLLAQRKPGIVWQISCVYCDAREEPLYEVCLHHWGAQGKVRKKLVFKGNTGELIPNGCHITKTTAPTRIEDALLDLINDA